MGELYSSVHVLLSEFHSKLSDAAAAAKRPACLPCASSAAATGARTHSPSLLSFQVVPLWCTRPVVPDCAGS